MRAGHSQRLGTVRLIANNIETRRLERNGAEKTEVCHFDIASKRIGFRILSSIQSTKVDVLNGLNGEEKMIIWACHKIV